MSTFHQYILPITSISFSVLFFVCLFLSHFIGQFIWWLYMTQWTSNNASGGRRGLDLPLPIYQVSFDVVGRAIFK